MANNQEEISLQSLKQGSDQALQQVYEDNRDKFINFARRYNLDTDDIIDIYQDAYIVFYNNVMSGKMLSSIDKGVINQHQAGEIAFIRLF